jgi:hypothetical protein
MTRSFDARPGHLGIVVVIVVRRGCHALWRGHHYPKAER